MMRRRSLLALLASLASVLSSPTVLGVEAKANLEVLSFNIRYPNLEDGLNYWALRVKFVADVMRERMPDVIGVQEALRSQLDDLAKHLPEYAEIGVGRDDGKTKGEYSAILYKKAALSPLENGTYWLSDTPEQPGSRTWNHVCPRVCTWARFRQAATGKEFYVFNTHWDNASAEARTKSSQLMVERIQKRTHPEIPFLITGDFNCGESSQPIQKLKSGLAVKDSFRIIHPEEKEVGTIHFWSGKKTNDKIDYILLSDQFNATEAEIIYTQKNGRFPSDHFPVRAKLSLK